MREGAAYHTERDQLGLLDLGFAANVARATLAAACVRAGIVE